jgi:hypothetical protein
MDAEAVDPAAWAGQAAGEGGDGLGVAGVLVRQVGDREVHGDIRPTGMALRPFKTSRPGAWNVIYRPTLFIYK